MNEQRPASGWPIGLLHRGLLAALSFAALSGLVAAPAEAGDLTQAPLWDGETAAAPDGELLNRYGGPVVHLGATNTMVTRTTSVVHSGAGAYCADVVAPAGGFAFFQLALSGFGPTPAYVMSRDVSRFDRLCFWILNGTGSPFTLKLEIKDYRDSNSHTAFRYIPVAAGAVWREVCAPWNLQNGWTVVGNPDLAQARLVGFVFEADQGQDVIGPVYFDDVALFEPGGPIDTDTAALRVVAERLARRQFEGLWGARSRVHGLIPSVSAYADVAALNTTSAVLWMLPTAVSRGWVSRAEAHRYVELLAATLNLLMDDAVYLPPRYVDWLTLQPNFFEEESPVDAAFLALALYSWKSSPTAPRALRLDRRSA